MILTCIGFITFLYLREKSITNKKLKNGTSKKEREREREKERKKERNTPKIKPTQSGFELDWIRLS